MAGNIQYQGVDEVIQAYENRDCPAFSIWVGKQFLFKYDGTSSEGKAVKPTIEEGKQLLEQFLNGVYQGTTAIYSLYSYEDWKIGQKIKQNTDYDGSFNFRINSPGLTGMGAFDIGNGLQIQRKNPLIDILTKMDQRLQGVEAQLNSPDDDDDDDEELSWKNVLMGFLEDPSKINELFGAVKSIFNMEGQTPATVNRIGSHETEEENKRPALSQPELASLGKSIVKMYQVDGDIVEHFEKLGNLAERDPNRFKGIVAMLDTM